MGSVISLNTNVAQTVGHFICWKLFTAIICASEYFKQQNDECGIGSKSTAVHYKAHWCVFYLSFLENNDRLTKNLGALGDTLGSERIER